MKTIDAQLGHSYLERKCSYFSSNVSPPFWRELPQDLNVGISTKECKYPIPRKHPIPTEIRHGYWEKPNMYLTIDNVRLGNTQYLPTHLNFAWVRIPGCSSHVSGCGFDKLLQLRIIFNFANEYILADALREIHDLITLSLLNICSTWPWRCWS